jgi:glycosyltransferase involved in cell wall biosynthesis/predicted O-methyltransferase YrrM
LVKAEQILVSLFSHPVIGEVAKQLYHLKTETECFHGDPHYRDLVTSLIKTCKPTHFIEMGTFLGRSSGFIAKNYPGLSVVTAEVNPTFAEIAQHRLTGSNTTSVVSDSVAFLSSYLPTLPHDAKLLIYLDSHWYDSWPLVEELELLDTYCNQLILIIDDFKVPGQPQFIYDNYGDEKVCDWEHTYKAMNNRFVGGVFPKYSKHDIPQEVSLAGYGVFFWDNETAFHDFINHGLSKQTHFSLSAAELNALTHSNQESEKEQIHAQQRDLSVASYSDVIDYMADKSLPYLVSFPRTGSHWLRMVLEKYLDRPILVRSFFHEAKPPYLLLHSHDMDLGLTRENILYLYRNPIDTIFSQLSFHNEDFSDKDRVVYWSKLYGQHLEKWLIHTTNYAKNATFIHYDELTDSSRIGFQKAIEYCGGTFDAHRLEQVVRELSKEKIKEKTAHDPRVTKVGSGYEMQRNEFKETYSDLVWKSVLDGKPELATYLGKEPVSSTTERVSHPPQPWEYKKIMALIPMKNEERFIETTLRAITPFVDSIVVFDDQSTDASVSIVRKLQKELPIEYIIERSDWNYNETVYRQALLDEGRKRGGTHFICIDADEIFTSNLLDDNVLRKQILALQPGDKLSLAWIQLWRSLDQYRYDDSVWTNNYKIFAFADDRTSNYDEQKLHLARHPLSLNGNLITINGYVHGLMHLQFVDWPNLLVKQAWYRILEKVMNPAASELQINAKYAPSKDETDLRLTLSPFVWFKHYSFISQHRFHESDNWRKTQVLGWFSEYGPEYFKHLDIWDVDWGVPIPDGANTSGLHQNWFQTTESVKKHISQKEYKNAILKLSAFSGTLYEESASVMIKKINQLSHLV